jgi:tetratricopeptide (TPR) repeat protein
MAMLLPIWFHRALIFTAISFSPCMVWAQEPAAMPSSPPAAAASPQADVNPSDPARLEAIRVYRLHKLPEAAELWEKVVAKYPRDTVAHEALGASLFSRANTQTDPEKRKADRLRARTELLRAQELGDKSDLSRVLLSGIHEDGSDAKFSNNSEVQAIMARGESAFAKAEWEDAIKEYTHALELDPTLYLAMVDIGDTYFRLKKFDTAGEWFAKAIGINPNQEIAYRYWADALMADGKMKDAREKFILGLVAFPYAKTSWIGLNGWLSRNHLVYNKMPIKRPQSPTMDEKGRTVLDINPANQNKSDGSDVWLTYSMERVIWKNKKFAEQFPEEQIYRHSLKEEVAVLSLVVAIFSENQQKNKFKDPDPGLVMLSHLQAEGLLESYALLVKADKDITQDYPAYRDLHRDKLIQFVDKYVVPPAP